MSHNNLSNSSANLLRKSVLCLLQKLFSHTDSATATVNKRLSAQLDGWVRAKRFCEDMSFSQVAESLDVSCEQLSHFFSSEVGVPFLSWRMELRIAEAKVLIEDHPDLPLSSIGQMVGITDRSNFRKAFLKVTGCSPADWRVHCRHLR